MRLVVDASVVLAFILDEDLSSTVRPLFDGDHILFGPDLLFLEVASAIWKSRRKGLLNEHDVDYVSDRFDRLRVVAVNMESSWRHALAIAVDLDHSVYDCAYLATSIREGAQLVSLDMKFRRKLQGTPWEMLAVHPNDLNLSH